MATVFLSYSHRDEELRDELEVHLAMLKSEGAIGAWHDRQIMAGDDWNHEIDEHLEMADVILLLVSPDFLASRYIRDIEVKRAMELHEEGKTRVIPIILRPCDWRAAPFAKLMAAPHEGLPVTTWPQRDEAFLDVVRHIRRALHLKQPETAAVARQRFPLHDGRAAWNYMSSEMRRRLHGTNFIVASAVACFTVLVLLCYCVSQHVTFRVELAFGPSIANRIVKEDVGSKDLTDLFNQTLLDVATELKLPINKVKALVDSYVAKVRNDPYSTNRARASAAFLSMDFELAARLLDQEIATHGHGGNLQEEVDLRRFAANVHLMLKQYAQALDGYNLAYMLSNDTGGVTVRQDLSNARDKAYQLSTQYASPTKVTFSHFLVNGEKGSVALTFIDGVSPEVTTRLLTRLKDENVHATFFLKLSGIAKYPALVKEIDADGHEIGIALFSLGAYPDGNAEDAIEEMESGRAMVFKACGKVPLYLRPPDKRFPSNLEAVCRKYSFKNIVWSVDPKDYQPLVSRAFLRDELKKIKPGAVVVSHNYQDSDPKVLPAIIDDIKKKGFEFLTVSQMMDREKNEAGEKRSD